MRQGSQSHPSSRRLRLQVEALEERRVPAVDLVPVLDPNSDDLTVTSIISEDGNESRVVELVNDDSNVVLHPSEIDVPVPPVLDSNGDPLILLTATQEPPVYSFATSNYETAEGQTVAITIKRVGDVSAAGSVAVQTVNDFAVILIYGIAQPGVDFVPLGNGVDPLVVEFEPGETEKTITITTLEDNLNEFPELIKLRLVDPANGTVGTVSETFIMITDVHTPSDNERFLMGAYRDLFGRQADATGLAFWNAYLTAGYSRATIVNALMSSDEYRARDLRAMYQQYLGREADEAGIQLGLQLYHLGFNRQVQVARLIGSEEYFQKHGGTVPSFLTAMVQDLSGRELTTQEMQSFSYFLSVGLSREQAALAVTYNPAVYAVRVRSFYTEILQREPSDAEVNSWVIFMQSGAPESQVKSAFFNSEEYRSRY